MNVKPEKILALDTALDHVTVAFLDREREKIFSVSQKAEREQAQILVPLINQILEEAGISYRDLDLLTATVGPGSFTGLRLSLSTLKTLKLVLKCPSVGVTTLSVLGAQYARSHTPERPFILLLETKRKDFYMQKFKQDGNPDHEPKAMTAAEILELYGKEDLLFCGNAVERFVLLIAEKEQPQFWFFDKTPMTLDPEFFVHYAYEGYDKGISSEDLSPVYLRGADVSKPKKENTRIPRHK